MILKFMRKKLRILYRNIKETILYYIVNWYSNSWYYYNVISPMLRFENIINNMTSNINEAKRWKAKKQFKYVPNCILNEIIKNKYEKSI